MLNKERGCVYFFRHIGLTPIKIGYSEEKSPINRFNSFRTYAPYGSELVGFIESYDAKFLEKELHVKFASKRLKGEWFEITLEDVENQIKMYSFKEEIELKMKFELEWAIKNSKKINISNNEKDVKSIFLDMYSQNYKIKKAKIARELGVSRATLYNWIKEYS